ncbi:MAG: CoA pyrophosphatase [Gammaproteobacteria bacterium]|nr:CoA pyrophosphatase [Gammaproteobacteria bacterium]
MAGDAMTFHQHFLDRLLALRNRETQTFPRDLLPADFSAAAVLLPFWPDGNGGVEVAMTLRPDHMPSHPGQVSFPGGRRHAGDATLADTALREAREELGIDLALVRVMGRLDDAWSVSGHHVVPYVGWLERRPALRPHPGEVADVMLVNVEPLLRPENQYQHRVMFQGVERVTPGFRWSAEDHVWGLTADILLELLLWVEGKPSNRAALRMQRMRLINSG